MSERTTPNRTKAKHGHLGHDLAELQKAVAKGLVQQHDGQPGGERRQKTVPARSGACGEGRQHYPNTVERLVLATDARDRVDPRDQPRAGPAYGEPDHGADQQQLRQESAPPSQPARLSQGHGHEDQYHREHDDVVGPRLYLQDLPNGPGDPLVSDQLSEDHRVCRGQNSGANERGHPAKAQPEGEWHRTQRDYQAGARTQDKDRHQPTSAKLLQLKLYRVEEEYQGEGQGSDGLQEGVP
jgi:hypothetical protein